MPDERAARAGRALGESASSLRLARIVALDEAECREVLARQRMCVMAVVDHDEPYAVPLYFGFDGESMYLGVAEGRKTRALDVNPRVCVVVIEAGPGDAWRSVEVAGVATALRDPADRARGIEVLIAHNRRSHRDAVARQAAAPGIRGGGRVLRIDRAVITGRARPVADGGAAVQAPHEPSTT